MSLLKAMWYAIPCWWHDGQLDIQPGLIRLRCAKCGRVTDGVQVPTLEEWQHVHRLEPDNECPACDVARVLSFKR